MEINKNYSGIMLEGDNGKFLFQLRDNKHGLSNRNKWGLFGGGIEAGETPVQTIIREIKEELGFKLNKDRMKILFKRESKKNKRFVFYYKLQNGQKDFKLGEGKKYRSFSLRDIIFRNNVVPSLRIFILMYPFFRFKMDIRKINS